MKRASLLLILLIGVCNLYGQRIADTTALNAPKIKVIARAQEDKIVLRWAVDEPFAWKQLNGSGYSIERHTITRDGITLPDPEKKVLTDTPLRPGSLESWIDLVQKNDNAAIVAQALYGESFQVTGGSEIETLVNMSEELEQRYTFTLFTADQDFEVARKAGLGYIDKDVKANEKYVYRVISNVPVERREIKYGAVFIGLMDYEPLPKPLDLAGTFNDTSVILSWNFKIMSTVYNSYFVERSTDGNTFSRINTSPYTTLNKSNQSKGSGRIFYVDSITNNKKYTYRVQGVSSFGELGPYSDIVSGEGKEVLKYVPHLTVKEILDKDRVKLTWEFEEEGNGQIKGFELNRSDGEGKTLEIVIENIPPVSRSILFDQLGPNPSNYFTITAVGKQGNKRTSFPMLVQPIDSIPPAKPLGLTGKVDSLGVVQLHWDKNKETDLLGYRIYRANNKKEEFSQLTVEPQSQNNRTDTVTIKNLNTKIYYKIIAVDKRYNMSEESDMLTLKKPDVIPPTSPVFKSYALKEGKVNLVWAQSSSDDVVRHMVYRKTNTNEDWQLVFETTERLEHFLDKDITPGNMYSYTILAMDDSGLESLPSPSVMIVVPKTSSETTVKGFYAQTDKANQRILLSWRYKEKDIAEFELYKSKKGEKLRLLRLVPADTRRLYDYDLTINTAYQYAIRAVFIDGRVSKTIQKEIKY